MANFNEQSDNNLRNTSNNSSGNGSTLKILGLVTVTTLVGFGAGMMMGKSGADHPANSTAATTATASKASDTAGVTPALTVSAASPTISNQISTLSANGNIAAWQEASVGAEVNGLRLNSVLVNVGDWVSKGQVLATFDAGTLDADFAQLNASLQEAEAALVDASANAKRYALLKSTGAVSEQQIQQYQTAEKTASARVLSIKASLAAQRVRVGNTKVIAPDSGLISARNASVGLVAGAGNELFRLIRQGRLEWRAELTANELGSIKTGQRVDVISPNNVRITGQVRTISPSINPQTRTALVYVDLPSSGTRHSGITQGMFAKGQFEMGSSNVLTLPQQAVVVRDGFNYVFKIKPDHHVEQVKITVGNHLADRVEVLTGVANSDQVAVKGAGFLNDGDLVRIAESTPLATAADASNQDSIVHTTLPVSTATAKKE